jgi:hypothetical protein
MIIVIYLLAGFMILIAVSVTRDLIGLSRKNLRGRVATPLATADPSTQCDPFANCPSCGFTPFAHGVVCHQCGWAGEIIITDKL